jgi:hypothetical protein
MVLPQNKPSNGVSKPIAGVFLSPHNLVLTPTIASGLPISGRTMLKRLIYIRIRYVDRLYT